MSEFRQVHRDVRVREEPGAIVVEIRRNGLYTTVRVPDKATGMIANGTAVPFKRSSNNGSSYTGRAS